MGCYDELEHADVFVLWGSNLAGMHPILWSRLTRPGCEVHVLSTCEHRCFELGNNNMVFTPQTDLAILNYIASYIIQHEAWNQDFVDRHVSSVNTGLRAGYRRSPQSVVLSLQRPVSFAGFVPDHQLPPLTQCCRSGAFSFTCCEV